MPTCPDCGLFFRTPNGVRAHRRSGMCFGAKNSHAGFARSAPATAEKSRGMGMPKRQLSGGEVMSEECGVEAGLKDAIGDMFTAAAAKRGGYPSEREIDDLLSLQNLQAEEDLQARERALLEQQVNLILPARQAQLYQTTAELRSDITQLKLSLMNQHHYFTKEKQLDFDVLRNEVVALKSQQRQAKASRSTTPEGAAGCASATPAEHSVSRRRDKSASKRRRRKKAKEKSDRQKARRRRRQGRQSRSRRRPASRSGSSSDDEDWSDSRGSRCSSRSGSATRVSGSDEVSSASDDDDDDWSDSRNLSDSDGSDSPSRQQRERKSRGRSSHSSRRRRGSGDSTGGSAKGRKRKAYGSSSVHIRKSLYDKNGDVNGDPEGREDLGLRESILDYGGLPPRTHDEVSAVATPPFPTSSTLEAGVYHVRFATLENMELSIPLSDVELSVKHYSMYYNRGEYVFEPTAERVLNAVSVTNSNPPYLNGSITGSDARAMSGHHADAVRLTAALSRVSSRAFSFLVPTVPFAVKEGGEMHVFVLQGRYHGRVVFYSLVFGRGVGSWRVPVRVLQRGPRSGTGFGINEAEMGDNASSRFYGNVVGSLATQVDLARSLMSTDDVVPAVFISGTIDFESPGAPPPDTLAQAEHYLSSVSHAVNGREENLPRGPAPAASSGGLGGKNPKEDEEGEEAAHLYMGRQSLPGLNNLPALPEPFRHLLTLPGMPGNEGPFLPPTVSNYYDNYAASHAHAGAAGEGGGPLHAPAAVAAAGRQRIPHFFLPPPTGKSILEWKGMMTQQIDRVKRLEKPSLAACTAASRTDSKRNGDGESEAHSFSDDNPHTDPATAGGGKRAKNGRKRRESEQCDIGSLSSLFLSESMNASSMKGSTPPDRSSASGAAATASRKHRQRGDAPSREGAVDDASYRLSSDPERVDSSRGDAARRPLSSLSSQQPTSPLERSARKKMFDDDVGEGIEDAHNPLSESAARVNPKSLHSLLLHSKELEGGNNNNSTSSDGSGELKLPGRGGEGVDVEAGDPSHTRNNGDPNPDADYRGDSALAGEASSVRRQREGILYHGKDANEGSVTSIGFVGDATSTTSAQRPFTSFLCGTKKEEAPDNNSESAGSLASETATVSSSNRRRPQAAVADTPAITTSAPVSQPVSSPAPPPAAGGGPVSPASPPGRGKLPRTDWDAVQAARLVPNTSSNGDLVIPPRFRSEYLSNTYFTRKGAAFDPSTPKDPSSPPQASTDVCASLEHFDTVALEKETKNTVNVAVILGLTKKEDADAMRADPKAHPAEHVILAATTRPETGLSIDAVVGLPLDATCTRLLIYIIETNHVDGNRFLENNGNLNLHDTSGYFTRKPDHVVYQKLGSSTMEPEFPGSDAVLRIPHPPALAPHNDVFAVVIIEYVNGQLTRKPMGSANNEPQTLVAPLGVDGNTTVCFGHCVIPIKVNGVSFTVPANGIDKFLLRQLADGNYVLRVKAGDPRRSQERNGPEESRPVARILGEQKRDLEKYSQAQLESSLCAQCLKSLLFFLPKKRSECVPASYVVFRLNSASMNAPSFREVPMQLPLSQQELTIFASRQQFKNACRNPNSPLHLDNAKYRDRTPMLRGITDVKMADNLFVDRPESMKDKGFMSGLAPYHPGRGLFIRVESICGMGNDQASYAVVVRLHGPLLDPPQPSSPAAPNDGRRVFATVMPDWLSDVGALHFKDPPFVRQRVGFDKRNVVVCTILKLTDLAPAGPSAGGAPPPLPKVEPVGWTVNKLFPDEPLILRSGRFVLPVLAGQPSRQILQELMVNVLDTVYVNNLKKKSLSFLEPKVSLTISQGDPALCYNIVDSTPFQPLGYQLLTPSQLKSEFPCLGDEGMVGCLLKTAHVTCFGGDHPRKLLQSMGNAIQQYIQATNGLYASTSQPPMNANSGNYPPSRAFGSKSYPNPPMAIPLGPNGSPQAPAGGNAPGAMLMQQQQQQQQKAFSQMQRPSVGKGPAEIQGRQAPAPGRPPN